ncbi:MAG: glycosyltransferase family 4 protein [Burkholderiales bacterium]
MNILLAMPWDQRTGGVTHVAASLARSLETRGHQALFLFPADKGFRISARTSLRGFPSIYCRLRDFPPEQPSWRARLSWYSTVLTTLPQLARHGLSRRVDLINVHYPGEGFALLVDLARWLRVPLVVSAHGSDLLPDAGPSVGKGLLRLLESADAVVVPSQNYLRSVVDAFPWLCAKIRCIHNGYDEEELSAVEAVPVGACKPDVTALCIAALIPKKGIDVLLRGLRQCTSGQLKVRLIGEGPLRRELESLSVTLGLSDRVSFLGPKDRDGVLDELVHCDLMVMPSRHPSESFGLAALEAMACAKPVIASAVGGLPELVGDRETGLLVRPEDPAALARALDLLAGDPAMRVSLGVAGRSKAKRFTVRVTADAYEALFTELVAQANGMVRPEK